MDLNFEINNQILTRTDDNEFVNKSRNYIRCNFSFKSSEWNGVNKFVIFKNEKDEAYEVYLGNSCECQCIIPSPVLTGSYFLISLYGGNVITTTEKRVVLLNSGYTHDISSVEDYDEDIFIQMLELLEGKADDADLSVVAKTGEYTDLNNLPNLSNVATSGDYNDLSNKPTVASLGADVQVNQLQTPNEGCIKSYQVLQGNERKGVYIDIPLIPFLKSAEVKTCTVENVPPGFHVGDIYFDLVFNTEDEDRHEYVDLSSLIDTYTSDNLTLQLVNGVFSVKNKGVGSAQLSDDVNLKLGYAEHYNSSVCKNITNNDILNWNNKQSTSNLVTSFGSTPSDTKYPSEKLVKDTIDNVIGTIDDWLTR